jgi:CRISPR-associated endonuclease Csn1
MNYFIYIFRNYFTIFKLEYKTQIRMIKILGLDLGTTSIGWSFINEAENENESSTIVNSGVRIVPLTTDEEADFKKGNTISINADRTLKRGARRGLQRFKQRREALLETFIKIKFIPTNFNYAETGLATTFFSYQLRAKSATEAVTKEELVKVLLMLNKKRGYKSSRKSKTSEEGDAIDGMKIALLLDNGFIIHYPMVGNLFLIFIVRI